MSVFNMMDMSQIYYHTKEALKLALKASGSSTTASKKSNMTSRYYREVHTQSEFVQTTLSSTVSESAWGTIFLPKISLNHNFFSSGKSKWPLG